MSKLRYGLQLTQRVRLEEEERKSKNIKATQIAQNKVLRLLDGSKIKDRRSIAEMLTKFDLLSVNQTSAQIKLLEAWKASRDPDFPVKFGDGERGGERETERMMRPTTRRRMNEGGKNRITEDSFLRDTGRIWNKAPLEIIEARTIETAKVKIRKYCNTLPI